MEPRPASNPARRCARWALRRNRSDYPPVASAGRARLAALDIGTVTDFLATLLTAYALKQRFRVAPQRGGWLCCSPAAADRRRRPDGGC